MGTAPGVTYDAAAPANLFNPGATINVQAAGGPDVGAFTATAVAPASVTGFTPPTTRTNGTRLTWTAGTGPKMMLALIGFTAQRFRIVLCRVNDTGSYTLSASNLALIPAASTTNKHMDRAFGWRFRQGRRNVVRGAERERLLDRRAQTPRFDRIVPSNARSLTRGRLHLR